MLRHTKDLRGFKLVTKDDEFGKVKEFYFDDLEWIVRYIRVDTIRWLPGRNVLISPVSINNINEAAKEVAFDLTKQQVKDSPPVDFDKPVSRQVEEEIVEYYSWPYYWVDEKVVRPRDPNLRKTKEVIGYSLKRDDEKIGTVNDIIIDDSVWKVRYFVIDVDGKEVLFSTEWVDVIDSDNKEMLTDVLPSVVRKAPAYSPEDMIDREKEIEIYDYYKSKYYWGG